MGKTTFAGTANGLILPTCFDLHFEFQNTQTAINRVNKRYGTLLVRLTVSKIFSFRSGPAETENEKKKCQSPVRLIFLFIRSSLRAFDQFFFSIRHAAPNVSVLQIITHLCFYSEYRMLRSPFPHSPPKLFTVCFIQ